MRRLLIVPTAAAVLLSFAVPAAVAAESGVVHRESVLTELDATGAPGTSRIFTQMTVPAGEEVRLSGQSLASLRTLSGKAAQSGDDVVFGAGLSRTVADHTADLPVEIDVSYSIDGQTVDADEVVGHDGEVAVTYTVTNLTAEERELTAIDGDRVGSKETMTVAVPMVASVSMTLPSMFDDVSAPGAVVVGDGRGNTVVNWSLLLFSPLGAETQQVTWTANARDAIVPEAVVQVLPVSPASFGSFGSTSAAYEGAVGSTRELTAGARQIDRNVKLLAEGAGKLLAGLVQLRDGSAQLSDGLVDARDGSAQLADGLGAARAGAGELSSGLGDLSDGASAVADGLAQLDAGSVRLSAGLGQLATGSQDLADGVGELSAGATLLDDNAKDLAAGAVTLEGGAAQLQAGINQLSAELQGAEGLPAALAGIDLLQAGIGTSSTPDTILYGLALIGAGLTDAQDGIGTPVIGDTTTLRGGVATANAGLAGVGTNNGTIGTLAGQVGTDIQTAITDLTPLNGDPVVADTITLLETNLVRVQTIGAISAGIGTAIGQLQGGLGLVDAGLAELSAGIGDTATADTLRNGVFRVTAGVSNPLCNPADPTNPANPCGLLEGLAALESGLSTAAAEVAAGLGDATTENTLLWGAAQVAGGSTLVADGAGRLQAEGTAALAAGAQQAAAGAEQLAAGAAQADAGATELGSGAKQLADGSIELADGAQRADAGGGDLLDGLVQLDEGGEQLADGLVDAADGSQQITDGLNSAVPGGEQLAGGAQRLTDEGTSVLARSVSDASASSSLQLAHVTAVAARGTAGDGLPYPTVEGADATAVYEFQLAGVGADAGPGPVAQVGLGGLALLAAALLGSVAGGRGARRQDPDELIEVPDLVNV